MCERKEEEAAGGGGRRPRDTEPKTRTPHKDVGKKYVRGVGYTKSTLFLANGFYTFC